MVKRTPDPNPDVVDRAIGSFYPYRLTVLLAAVVLALALVALALLPRYEMTDAGRLDRWTGQVCQLAPPDAWTRPGAARLLCTP